MKKIYNSTLYKKFQSGRKINVSLFVKNKSNIRDFHLTFLENAEKEGLNLTKKYFERKGNLK